MCNNLIKNITSTSIINPEKVAIIDENRTYSYMQLSLDIQKIATYLKSNNITIENVVGINIKRSYYSICATLAIMKVGAAFLPMDNKLPKERIQYMCQKADVKMVLCDNLESICENDSEQLKFVAIKEILYQQINSEAFNVKLLNDQLAYVIFTSGTTGTPKGVMIEYAGMINHIEEKITLLHLDNDSVVAFNASIGFDISIWQMLSPLMVGGTVAIFSDEEIMHVAKFCRMINEREVTHLEVVPTYFNLIINELQRENICFKNMKYIISTGEKLNQTTVCNWFNLQKDTPIVNAYGPTEASDDILHYFIMQKENTQNIPIGKPIKNVTIRVVNDHGDDCKVNEVGELYVSGVCVARGYINDDIETSKHFMHDTNNTRVYKTGDLVSIDSNGNYLIWGRIDSQIKLRGNRIELEEIERFFEKSLDSVEQAIAVFDEEKNIIRLAVFNPNNSIDMTLAINAAKKSLPEYMVPNQIHQIDVIPRTINEKVDKTKVLELLKELDNSEKKQSDSSNFNRIEDKIKSFIIDLIDQDLPQNDEWKSDMRIIGFDSLLVIQLILKVEEEYNFEFPDIDLRQEIVYNYNNFINAVKRNLNNVG